MNCVSIKVRGVPLLRSSKCRNKYRCRYVCTKEKNTILLNCTTTSINLNLHTYYIQDSNIFLTCFCALHAH